MRKHVALLLTITLILGLCACGKPEPENTERECGVFVTIEANDVYTVSYGTETDSEACGNADKSALMPGEVIHFDFAGPAAEGTAKAIIGYSICIYDKDMNILASESFSSDFSNMARIDITVTADHRILNNSDKLVCGGEIIVDMKTEKPKDSVTLTVPTVTMPERSEAADKINENIASVNASFTGSQYDNSKKAYKLNADSAEDGAKVDKFSMKRSVSVTRGDSEVLSIRMNDKTNLGTKTSASVTGHNYDSYTGSELKLADIATDLTKLTSICSEEILISTTDADRFGDVLFNDGYTDTLSALVSDGHWYLNADGMVFTADPGEIADDKYGSFEFTVSYGSLSSVLKPDIIPEKLAGDSNGEIAADFTVNLNSGSSLVIVGKPAEKESDCVIVTVTGKISSISLYSVSYKSSGKLSVGSQLWYCSDLSEGAAFIVDRELKSSPDLMIAFTRPDGSYQRRLLSLDNDGKVCVDDADGMETGLIISDELPYQTDLNGDGVQETINAERNGSGKISAGISSSGKLFNYDTDIISTARLRVFDVDGDGVRELYIEGKNSDGSALIYSVAFDHELKVFTFGEDKYLTGTVKGFSDGALVVKTSVDILGSHSAGAYYSLKDGVFSLGKDYMLSGGDYVRTVKEIPLSGGSTLLAGSSIKFTATDLETYVSFKANNGDEGTIALEKSESGWTVNGEAFSGFFDKTA